VVIKRMIDFGNPLALGGNFYVPLTEVFSAIAGVP